MLFDFDLFLLAEAPVTFYFDLLTDDPCLFFELLFSLFYPVAFFFIFAFDCSLLFRFVALLLVCIGEWTVGNDECGCGSVRAEEELRSRVASLELSLSLRKKKKEKKCRVFNESFWNFCQTL